MISKIVVVGGGSAGTMSAYTLKKLFPEKQIVLLESDSIPTVGVGESTLGQFNQWLALVDIEDKDFMKECNASYKMSIKFNNFYQLNDTPFHYPFGVPHTDGNVAGLNDWYIKKILEPKTKVSDYADCYYPIMALVNQNKILTDDANKDIGLPNYSFKRNVAYHFDAVQFANWLRKKFKEIGGDCKIGTITKVTTNEEGIDQLYTEEGRITGDLFIDCTGFNSLLLNKTLKEPFVSYEDILPNNSAWAAQIPYNDKEKELKPYTNCTALSNGWVWNIPLWNRIGTGYVYSDKYISDQDALKEFKKHLGYDGGDLKFKNIKINTGLHQRLFVKNVVAIGLSAGFIEPLESNGLISVHEFLIRLVRLLRRPSIPQYLKNHYNMTCGRFFRVFAEFVASHFALSCRNDSPYWRAIQNRNYEVEPIKGLVNSMFQENNFWVFDGNHYPNNTGMHCIAAGMNFHPTDEYAIRYATATNDLSNFNPNVINNLYFKKEKWNHLVKNCPSMYDYLKNNIYS